MIDFSLHRSLQPGYSFFFSLMVQACHLCRGVSGERSFTRSCGESMGDTWFPQKRKGPLLAGTHGR